MNKINKIWSLGRLLILGSFLSLTPQLKAQKVQLELGNDSTFNAAEDYAQMSEGFDVDINKVNVLNIGFQIAQDVVVASCNDKEVFSKLPNKSYYRQRGDLMLSAALPERTNVYSIITFINDNDNCMFTFSNLEVEHFFNERYKIRLGRLANSVSESQYFGRLGLEESSAHVFGRKIFINDALEFDASFKKIGGPSLFFGLKPRLKPFNLRGVYGGIHQSFKNGIQLHGIVSFNRQFESEMKPYIPEFEGKDSYFSYEAEVAYKKNGGSVFLNVGGNLGYIGLIPHASGKFDFIKQLLPVVTDKSDSFKETFTPSTGFRIRPAKLSPKWSFLPQAGLEAEVQGALTDRFTALNICAYCKFNITKRMVLTYYCTPNFIWQDCNDKLPHNIVGVSNFFRLSVTVGKPTRMFL